MSEQPVLDPTAIAALNSVVPDDGGAFLRELLDIFLADTPKRIQEIDTSLAAADIPTLTRAAHSIKGSSSNFGASVLVAVAKEMEAAAKASDLAKARELRPLLQAEFERVRAAMDVLRAS